MPSDDAGSDDASESQPRATTCVRARPNPRLPHGVWAHTVSRPVRRKGAVVTPAARDKTRTARIGQPSRLGCQPRAGPLDSVGKTQRHVRQCALPADLHIEVATAVENGREPIGREMMQVGRQLQGKPLATKGAELPAPAVGNAECEPSSALQPGMAAAERLDRVVERSKVIQAQEPQ